MAQVPGDKTVLGLGNYGYDWVQGNTNAADLTFDEAAQTAQETSPATATTAYVSMDPASLNPYFTYSDDPDDPTGRR